MQKVMKEEGKSMLNMGVVGYGYWGPNIVRNFNMVEGIKVQAVCDSNSSALARVGKIYHDVRTCSNYLDITASSDIDTVAVVTPVFTHYEIAKSALMNGKHIFVEKPFTSTVREAEELIELAERKNLKIIVDHTFLFTGAVRKIKELVEEDILGETYYYDSTRVNLGLFQHDINVIWDLAPHDFSIMDYIIKERPVAVSATGADHFNRGLADVAYVTTYFDNHMIAHFNINWLSPVKVRTTLIGGRKKMLVWNDLEADEKIKLYDRGVDIENKEGVYSLLVDYRSGDMWAPRIDRAEALRIECEHFAGCVLNGTAAINDGYAGLRIVRMLEATDKSLKEGGRMIYL
jgi:predicted dehydrogenase